MFNVSEMIRDNMIVTIVTASFLPYAKAIRAAVAEFDETVGFVAIVIDPTDEASLPGWVISQQTLSAEQPRAQQLMAQYHASEHSDFLRWSLKSQLLLYCIRNGAKKVLWCDPDLMFFEDPKPLFEMIEPETVLLSPHYRAFRPSTNDADFRKNFTEGMFQAGFLGIGQNTAEMLDWWAEACLWEMSKDPAAGTYVDQKFLDLLPVYWSGTKILKHRGCNIADWNWDECRRTGSKESTLINGQDPIIFIHFTDGLNAAILRGRDTILLSYVERYTALMKRFDPDFQLRLPQRQSSPDVAGKNGMWVRAARLLRDVRDSCRQLFE
jgi:hypothetical protein